MRAAVYHAYSDDVQSVTVEEVPPPKLMAGAVLIDVKAAGVNPVDWKLMSGAIDGALDALFPVIPGWDVAGVVVKLGADTPEFSVGDEVMGYARKDVLHAGTFAEQVVVNAVALARKPPSLSWEQAGALPLAGGTALRTLDHLDLKAGQSLLIHAAAGGVGGLAVQIAAAAGVRVIGTASDENHSYLRSLGAEPVEYGDGLAERIRAIAPEGVDAVADFVGGQLAVTRAVLAPGGRHASVADPAVVSAGGAYIWVRPDGTQTARLADLVDQGKLGVDVAQTFSLDEVGDALLASQSGHGRGKYVIVPRSGGGGGA